MICKNLLSSWYMVQECDVLLSWYPSPGRWLAWLAAVVLPAPTLHAVTKLLELLVTRLGLILFCGRVVHQL
jgi:hypothetical protein